MQSWPVSQPQFVGPQNVAHWAGLGCDRDLSDPLRAPTADVSLHQPGPQQTGAGNAIRLEGRTARERGEERENK